MAAARTTRPSRTRRAPVATLTVLAFLAATLGAIRYVDRPVSRWVHGTFPHHALAVAMTRPPEYLARLCLVLLAVLGLRAAARPLGGLWRGLLLASLAVTVAAPLTDFLKFCFGRTWPETWTNRNLSWIRDGVFTFMPFHGGAGWASFPSGHMAVTGAFVGTFWMLAPRWRGLVVWPVWVLCLALVAAGLLGADYHFVSDVVAGTAVGLAVAATLVRAAA